MNKLESLISDVFSYQQAETDTEIVFQDLESWDSLTHMNFVVAVEQEFNLELTADEIIEMQSYTKAKEILSKRGVNI
ncbi:MAG: acyl carrier protein [Melioribacteraceae bacterium]|nr:MAG: acyl carrier protein [Melioribacteraceae bacterium]